MKKISVLFIILFTLFLFSCKSKTTKKHIEKTVENNLLEQTTPLKGDIKLGLKKVLSFDPSKTNIEALGAKIVEKDDKGNYYFVVPEKAMVLKYSPKGKFLRKICKYGLGPGEMRYVDHIKPVENGVFLSNSREIMKIDEKGKAVLKRTLKQVYSSIETVDDNRYIASFYEMVKSDKRGQTPPYKKAFGLFNIDERLIKKYVTLKDLGIITVKITKGIYSISISGLNSNIEWSYDAKNRIIYYGIANEYKIFAVQLNGKKQFSFGRTCKRKTLSETDKEKIGKRFDGLPKELKRAFLKQLPNRLMFFSKIKVLPSGYIAVYIPSRDLSNSIDIFDNKGYYIYHLNPLKKIKFGELMILTDGHLGYLKETDKGILFTEYRVKKPKEIFLKEGNNK